MNKIFCVLIFVLFAISQTSAKKSNLSICSPPIDNHSISSINLIVELGRISSLSEIKDLKTLNALSERIKDIFTENENDDLECTVTLSAEVDTLVFKGKVTVTVKGDCATIMEEAKRKLREAIRIAKECREIAD